MDHRLRRLIVDARVDYRLEEAVDARRWRFDAGILKETKGMCEAVDVGSVDRSSLEDRLVSLE